MSLSRHSVSRKVLFREVFTPSSIAANHGQITGGVTFGPDGATMDGTGYITYTGNKDLSNKSQFTIRMKAKRAFASQQLGFSFLTDANNRVELLWYTDGGIYGVNSNGGGAYTKALNADTAYHDVCFVYDGSGATDSDKAKLYLDGVYTLDSFNGTLPVNSITLGTLRIGKCNTGNSRGSFELVEIYDGALSPETVSLLYSNKLYQGFVE